ncbi:MAG: ETC complex I subunit [Pseudomonadota bacterium]
MVVRIYQPARTAMQSGVAKSKHWVLDHGVAERRQTDPLMGWSGSGDTQSQVQLTFDSKEAAIAYAERHGLAYRVEMPKSRKPVIRPGGYGDNFRYNRRSAWTH